MIQKKIISNHIQIKIKSTVLSEEVHLSKVRNVEVLSVTICKITDPISKEKKKMLKIRKQFDLNQESNCYNLRIRLMKLIGCDIILNHRNLNSRIVPSLDKV